MESNFKMTENILSKNSANQNTIIKFNPLDRQEEPGKFFIVSGSSGVGKNTLLEIALNKIQGLYYLPSITTRKPREGEEQGNPYYFTEPEEFMKMIEANVFLEWKKIHNGNFYGTHLPTIKYALDNGYNIITDMDVLGFQDAKKKFSNNIISIFIEPPSMIELEKRLSIREKDTDIVKIRLNRAKMELSHKKDYDFVILNDSLTEAGDELISIILNYF